MELVGIEKELTIEQKAAIASILIIVAKADKEVLDSEIEEIEKVANFLDFDVRHPLMQKIAIGRKAELMSLLNTLTKTQKKWLITKMFLVIMADGKAKDIEQSFFEGISKDLGFAENEVIKIIEEYKMVEYLTKHLKK